MNKSDQSLLGTLSKLHGVKGAYQLFSDRTIDENIENWESVFLEIQGLLVPFFIESVRVTSEQSVIIKFEDINSPEAAREFISCDVYHTPVKHAKSAAKKENTETFEGYLVVDKLHGAMGTVIEVLNYNQNILLSLKFEGKEILIPVSEEIILSVDHKKKVMHMDIPEGLIDLN